MIDYHCPALSELYDDKCAILTNNATTTKTKKKKQTRNKENWKFKRIIKKLVVLYLF